MKSEFFEDGAGIVAEYEKIKDAENVKPEKILSSERMEDLLGFPIESEERLRRTDRIYMTDDSKRLLLIREYAGKKSPKTVKSEISMKKMPQTDVNLHKKCETPLNSSSKTTQELNKEDFIDGYTIDFKVFVADKENEECTHEIHVQANCDNFVPQHLYINGKDYLQNNVSIQQRKTK